MTQWGLCRWSSALLVGVSHVCDIYLQAVLAQEVPAEFSCESYGIISVN